MLGTLGELAQRLGGRAIGDPAFQVANVSAIDEAGPDSLTFATTAAYLEGALKSRAGAVLVDEALLAPAQQESAKKPLIAVASARAALAALLQSMEPARKRGPYRDPAASVDDTATIGPDVYIGAGAIVGAGARIGARTVLEAGSFVGAQAQIGEDVLFHPQAAVLDRCVVGDRSILHCGAVIGSDGFGYVFIDGTFERIPQVGNVVLGSEVEIGANSCVDRAQTGSTHIGDGTKIDNLVQIAHNCRIGKHCAIAALTGMAGSTVLGDYVQVAGQVGFRGHLTVGDRVRIAGKSGVFGDLAPDGMYSGYPARPHGDEMRREVMLHNLPKLVRRVDALEKRND